MTPKEPQPSGLFATVAKSVAGAIQLPAFGFRQRTDAVQVDFFENHVELLLGLLVQEARAAFLRGFTSFRQPSRKL